MKTFIGLNRSILRKVARCRLKKDNDRGWKVPASAESEDSPEVADQNTEEAPEAKEAKAEEPKAEAAEEKNEASGEESSEK